MSEKFKLIPISEIPHRKTDYQKIIETFLDGNDTFCEVQIENKTFTTVYSGLQRASKQFQGKVKAHISMKEEKAYLEKLVEAKP